MGYGTGHAVVAARCRVALRQIGGYRWGDVPLLSRVAGWLGAEEIRAWVSLADVVCRYHEFRWMRDHSYPQYSMHEARSAAHLQLICGLPLGETTQ